MQNCHQIDFFVLAEKGNTVYSYQVLDYSSGQDHFQLVAVILLPPHHHPQSLIRFHWEAKRD